MNFTYRPVLAKGTCYTGIYYNLSKFVNIQKQADMQYEETSENILRRLVETCKE